MPLNTIDQCKYSPYSVVAEVSKGIAIVPILLDEDKKTSQILVEVLSLVSNSKSHIKELVKVTSDSCLISQKTDTGNSVYSVLCFGHFDENNELQGSHGVEYPLSTSLRETKFNVLKYNSDGNEKLFDTFNGRIYVKIQYLSKEC